MQARIKVYAKAMNRTALGIVNAYIQLNPKVKYLELKKAFPDTLYEEVEGGYFNTIKPLGVFQSKEIVDSLPSKNLQQCHFMKDDEAITLADGIVIFVTSSWGKNALDRLTAHVKQFGIEVAESSEGDSFKRGEYRLELLTPIKENNNTKKIIVGAATVAVLGGGGFGIMQKCSTDAIKDKVIEEVKDEAKGQVEDYAKEKLENAIFGNREISIHLVVAELKADKNSWDPANGKPDPEITVLVDGKEISKIEKSTDMFEVIKSFTASIPEDSKVLEFKVNDNDENKNEIIGKANLTLHPDLEINKEIALKTEGLLKSFKLTFIK